MFNFLRGLLRMSRSLKLYNNLVYTAKGIVITEKDLPKEILEKIDIENLKYDFRVTPIRKTIDNRALNEAVSSKQE